MKELRNECKILIRKSEEKKTLGRPRHRWAVNIKLYRKGMRYGAWT
jgi:hypothetical protein